MTAQTKLMTSKTIVRLAIVLLVVPLAPMILSGVCGLSSGRAIVCCPAFGNALNSSPRFPPRLMLCGDRRSA